MASLQWIQQQLKSTSDTILISSPSRLNTPPAKISIELVGEDRLTAIIENICYNIRKTFANQNLRRTILEDLIKTFETENIHDACHTARLTLLLHATKATWDNLSTLHGFIVQTREMTFSEVTQIGSVSLTNYAYHALQNSSVWTIAQETADGITGKKLEGRFPVEVRVVKHRDYLLYGFAGNSVIYLNVTALGTKFETIPDISRERGDTAFKIDLTMLALHELTHVIVRKLENNLNASTPTEMARTRFKPQFTMAKEAGRIAETAFFGGPAREFCPDLLDFNLEWGKQLIHCLEVKEPLPKYIPEYGGVDVPDCLECATNLPIRQSRKVIL